VKKFWCGLFIVWPFIAIGACLIAPYRGWWFPGDGVAMSSIGARIDGLFYVILAITTIVYIGTQVALGYVLWRGAHNREGKAVFSHGSHALEVLWTIAPSGVLLFIALYQMDTWAAYRVQSQFPEAAVNQPIAVVTARQFEWRIRYPAPGTIFKNAADRDQWIRNPAPGDLYTVNDLHVPVGRPVLIHLRSGDVQHSFFVPAFRIKQDAIPGEIIPIWFDATKIGKYELLCAELCGWGHYKMRGQVDAQAPDDYQAYLKKLQIQQSHDGYRAKEKPSVVQVQ